MKPAPVARDLTRFDFPTHKLTSLNDLDLCNWPDGIYTLWSEDCPVDWIFESADRSHSYLLICFGGAITNRSGAAAPFFSGVNIARELRCPILSFSDPTLSLSSTVPIGWYAGNELVGSTAKIIAAVIQDCVDKKTMMPILFGASAGGFACLVQSELLSIEAKYCVWNPQTSISRYNEKHVFEYLQVAFSDFRDFYYSRKNSLSAEQIYHDFMDKKQLRHSVLTEDTHLNGEVLYLQNKTDWHVKSHFFPYINTKKMFECGQSIFQNTDASITALLADWGSGHVTLPREDLLSILRLLMAGEMTKTIAQLMLGRHGKFYQRSASHDNCLGCQPTAVFWISNGHIYATIRCEGSKNGVNDRFYAFYLYIDGVRQEVIWYQDKSTVNFNSRVDQSSVIKVEAFVKESDGLITKVSASPLRLHGTVDPTGRLCFSVSEEVVYGADKLLFYVGSRSIEVERIAPRNALKKLVDAVCKSGMYDDRDVYFLSEEKEGFDAGVTVEAYLGNIKTLLPWTNPRMSLEMLKTTDEKCFMERFTYASTRHHDANTIRLIAQNNIGDSGVPLNIRINSTVIFAYKILEGVCFQEWVETLLGYMSQAERWCDEIPSGFGARKDKVHLKLSLFMAKCHVYLTQRKFDELVNIACRSVELLDKIPFRGYYSVNYAKILFVGAISANREGKEDVEVYLLDEIFHTVPLMEACINELQPGWLYSERKYVDNLVQIAVEVKKGVLDLNSGAHVDKALREAVRVKGDAFLKSIEGI